MNLVQVGRHRLAPPALCFLSLFLLLTMTACGNQSGDAPQQAAVQSGDAPQQAAVQSGDAPQQVAIQSGDAPQRAAILTCDILSGDRLVGGGYSQPGSKPQLAVFIFDSSGNLDFQRTFSWSGETDSAGIGTALVVDPQDHIYLGGSQLLSQVSRAYVAALTDRGDLIWESAPIAAGSSGVNALAYDASGLYVTGFVGTPGTLGEPHRQAIFLMKLDLRTGAVLWQQLIEDHTDPMQISAGLSLDVGPAGWIAVTGVTYQAVSGPDWFAGVWDTNGNLLWQDIRHGSGSILPHGIGDLPDLAWKGRFDDQGNVYVVGRLHQEGRGADMHVIKYSPLGEILWEFNRHEVLIGGTESFDEAKHIAVGAQQLWVSGTVSRKGALAVVLEGIVMSLSLDGTLLWEQHLAAASLSGEDILDLVADSQGNVYYGGMSSSTGIDKDLILEMVDRSGKKLWSTVLEFSDSDHFDHDSIHGIKLGRGSKLFAAGTLHVGDGHHAPLALELDRDGHLQWAFPLGVVTTSAP